MVVNISLDQYLSHYLDLWPLLRIVRVGGGCSPIRLKMSGLL